MLLSGDILYVSTDDEILKIDLNASTPTVETYFSSSQIGFTSMAIYNDYLYVTRIFCRKIF